MRKFYLVLCAAGLVGTAVGQVRQADKAEMGKQKINRQTVDIQNRSNIWTNTFSDASEWVIGNAGSDGLVQYTSDFNWEIGNVAPAGAISAATMDPINSTTAADGSAIIDSDLYAITGQANAELIENCWIQNANPIDCSAQAFVSVSFEAYARLWAGEAFFSQGYHLVELSDDGVTWPDVTTYTEAEADPGTRFQLWPELGNTDYNPGGNAETVALNISEFAGGKSTMYIRFRWVGYYSYAWCLDDVCFYETLENDVQMNEAYVGDWENAWDPYKTPYTQAPPMSFGARLTNFGYADAPALPVSYNVNGGAFSVTQNVELLSNQSSVVFLETAFQPNTAAFIGDHEMTVSIPDDESMENNSGSKPFEISEFLYANGNDGVGTELNERTFNETFNGQEYAIGQRFQINADATAYAIEVNFGPGTTDGEEVTVRIIGGGDDINQGTFDSSLIVAEADYTIPLEATYPGGVARVAFPAGFSLLAGVVYQVEVLKSYEGVMSIMAAEDGDIDSSTLCLGDFGNADPTFNWYVGWGWTPSINISFDPDANETEVFFIGVEEVAQANFELGQNVPNPAANSTRIAYNMQQAGAVNFEVFDITGKQVFAQYNGQKGSGNHSIELDLSSFESGVYTYTLTVDGVRSTKKMIVQ